MMSNCKGKATWWYGLIFIVLLVSSPVSYGDTAGLKLTLLLAKERVVLGEPVYLTASLKNMTPKSALIFPSLYPEDSALQIIVRSKGQQRPFVPYSLDLTDLSFTELHEGESITAVFPIFFGGRGWVFQTEGTYQIEAVFVDPSGGKVITKSVPVELVVSSGDGSGTFLLEKSKGGDEAGKFLLWQSGDHLRAGIAHLEALIEQHPTSVVSDYARLAFASNLSRPFRDYGTGKLRKPDPEAALEYLKKVKSDRFSSYSQVWQLATALRSQTLLGDQEAVQRLRKHTTVIIDKNPALRQLLESVELQ